MIKALFIIALALLPEAAFAQSTDTMPPERITKVIRVHYGNPEKFANIVSHNAPVTADWDDTLKAVILKGSRADIAKAEQTIKELDQPPIVSTDGDIELVVHIIGGSDEPATPSSDGGLATIGPVVKQLQTIFPYKNYELVSTMFMRSQQGKSAESSGLLKYPFGAKASSPDIYKIAYSTATVSSDKLKPTIHLGNFQFNVNIVIAGNGSFGGAYRSDVGIHSDVDLRPGQQVVVGNTNVPSGNSALFIVLSAKLVD